jgi:hypothetical protein
MNPREPDHPLRSHVSRHYRLLRRALTLRESLRAAGRTAVVVTVAVAAGVAWPAAEPLAWVRWAVVTALAAAAVALAVAGFLRARPSFDTWLERIEERFPAVRSWLRNALDFERRPPAHTYR